MKQLRTFFLLVVCIISLQAFCEETFTVGNLKYTIISNYSKTVSVSRIDASLSGDIIIPEYVTYNGIEYHVTGISTYAFYSCNITSVAIPNSVTSIGQYAFTNCSGLTSLTIPNSVISIDYGAFQKCTGLTTINIPNSVTSIGASVFSKCDALTTVSIGNGVTIIGANAFDQCISLITAKIGNNVKTIASYAFRGCGSLISVTIPNSVETIGDGAFSGCIGMKSLYIGNGVMKIESEAFKGCSELISVSIGNSVWKIGARAFQNCSNLSSITLPGSITRIDNRVFEGCSNLTSITSLRETPGTLANDAFPDYNVPLYVPTGCIGNYKAADGWKQFTNIQEIGGGGVTNKCATPTISFGGKKLSFDCETEGVEYVTEIKDADVGMFYDDKIALSATYEISVFATKAGYENSDKATATLVWSNATFTDTTPLTAINHVLQSHAMPVLIQSNEGTVTVQGADDGTQIGIYTVAGIQAGSAVSNNGSAIIHTDIQVGSVAIVKIGGKAVKILIK